MILTTEQRLEKAGKLARLTLQLGRVDRATVHEDGVLRETDTTHTCMLVTIACELCPWPLDVGRVAQLALAHDYLEARAGDVDTLRASSEERLAKKVAEKTAFDFLEKDLGHTSRLVQNIREYEEQKTPEARFVRIMDKVMPRLTQILAHGAPATNHMTFEQFQAYNANQLEELRLEYPEQDAWARTTLNLLEASMRKSERAWPRKRPEIK